ncbi:hypothetical protein BC829DRAFT_436345 [Chytridium lagenaria]|nr:hypothetical protein BC829DRAFT_436345 [Chytridium lagenaria]
MACGELSWGEEESWGGCEDGEVGMERRDEVERVVKTMEVEVATSDVKTMEVSTSNVKRWTHQHASVNNTVFGCDDEVVAPCRFVGRGRRGRRVMGYTMVVKRQSGEDGGDREGGGKDGRVSGEKEGEVKDGGVGGEDVAADKDVGMGGFVDEVEKEGGEVETGKMSVAMKAAMGVLNGNRRVASGDLMKMKEKVEGYGGEEKGGGFDEVGKSVVEGQKRRVGKRGGVEGAEGKGVTKERSLGKKKEVGGEKERKKRKTVGGEGKKKKAVGEEGKKRKRTRVVESSGEEECGMEEPDAPTEVLVKPIKRQKKESGKPAKPKTTDTDKIKKAIVGGWGDAHKGAGRLVNDGIGSSNFRSMKLNKTRFMKGGSGGRGGKFGNVAKNLKSYTYGGGRGGGGDVDNPWASFREDEIGEAEDLVGGEEVPDVEFWGVGEDDDELCGVTFFLAVVMSGKVFGGGGQVEALKKILAGRNSLVVLPTGGGKSLCYQLPTFIVNRCPGVRHGVTVVVSPMISLMQDQMRCLPGKLRGACFGSDQRAVWMKLEKGEIDVLFVSPERMQMEAFRKGVKEGDFHVRFLCVDEVHCMTEWSHNFRTSYLTLPATIEECFGRPCVVGLTGTATLQSRGAILEGLGVDEGDVVTCDPTRGNLKLRVEVVETGNKDELVLELLKSPEYVNLNSIIIYTMFQSQADNLSQFLRVRNFDAESYHGGRSGVDRKTIQNRFMGGRLRIVVATVAFGLGVNKRDVRSVVHYCMPKAVESYVQEIGRAGRDGLPALCHVFLTQADYIKHRSFAHSETIDETGAYKFMRVVLERQSDGLFEKGGFWSCARDLCGRRVMMIWVEGCEREMDVKESVLETVLCYLEMEGAGVRVLQEGFRRYCVKFIKSKVESLADEHPVVEHMIRYGRKPKSGGSSLEFDVLELCSKAKISIADLMSSLATLKRKKEVIYDGLERAFQVELMYDDEGREERVEVLRRTITRRVNDQEVARVVKLDQLYEMLAEGARRGRRGRMRMRCRCGCMRRDEELLSRAQACKKSLLVDLQHFITTNVEVITSGRAIAKIFHGISSPKFPSSQWYHDSMWGAYTHIGFGELARLATKALVEIRTFKERREGSKTWWE